MKQIKSISIVVVSCDKYSDLWKPTIKQLKACGLAQSAPIYLISNHKRFDYNGVINLTVGDDQSWTANLRLALRQIQESTILLLVDDFYIFDVAPEFEITEVPRLMNKLAAAHIKFFQQPLATEHAAEEGVKMYSKFQPYAISVCGFWNKRILLEMLQIESSAWNFERTAGKEITRYGRSFAFVKPPFKFLNLVEKGRWSRKTSRKFLLQNDYSPTERSFLSLPSKIYSALKDGYFDTILKVNWKKREKVVQAIKKLLVVH